MSFDPAVHNRINLRLKEFNYASAGAYFVTLCCQHRLRQFGKIQNREMILSAAGHMVHDAWLNLSKHIENIEISTFVVMPDHFHGIILLHRPNEDSLAPDLINIMQRFKSWTTRQYIRGVESWGWPKFPGRLWQRSYHERIIRDEYAFHRISGYIQDNPKNWVESASDLVLPD